MHITRNLMVISLLVAVCSAQSRHVYNFRSATWNSDGAKWNRVSELMTDRNLQLDVLAVQEAGSVSSIASSLTNPLNNIPTYLEVIPYYSGDLGLVEKIWNVRGQSFYLYYYSNNQGSSKQSMAIVSRTRAQEMIVLPPQVRHTSYNLNTEQYQDRSFINRPVIAIRIENSVFFNIHAEPSRSSNEAPLQVRFVEEYMQARLAALTWLALGDYNREPHTVALPAGASLVRAGRPTFRRRGAASSELDYAVAGGAGAHQPALARITAALVLPINQQDHTPVQFM